MSFAYPYGDLNANLTKLIENVGYTFAVATDSGTAVLSDNLFQIRRIAIFPTNNMFNFRRKVSGKYNMIKLKNKI